MGRPFKPKVCRECGADTSKLPKWLQIQRNCRECSKLKWRMLRANRAKKGTLKCKQMPPEYHTKYDKLWREENRAKTREYAKNARKRSPHKAKARDMVNKAVKNGELLKIPCVICGNKKSEGHHEDYSKPLEVIWLCRKHHREHHSNKTKPLTPIN